MEGFFLWLFLRDVILQPRKDEKDKKILREFFKRIEKYF